MNEQENSRSPPLMYSMDPTKSNRTEVAKHPITKHGFTYWTKYDTEKAKSTGDTFCYLLRPLGIAKVSPLRDKLALIVDLRVMEKVQRTGGELKK